MVWCNTQGQFTDNRTLSFVSTLERKSCMLGEEETRKEEGEVKS
jgi:hypothetical protein